MLFKTYDASVGGYRLSDLSNLYAGSDCAAFIVGGAPSLDGQNPSILERRGIVSFAVNNAGLVFRPTYVVCSDMPECLSKNILFDPSIVKFASDAFHGVAVRKGDPRIFAQCPATMFYSPDDQLSSIPGRSILQMTRMLPYMRNSLMHAFCIVASLGFRRIYLCGSDFYAGKPGERSYAGSNEGLDDVKRSWNENLYRQQVVSLLDMRMEFSRHGIDLVDTSANSKIAGASSYSWRPLSEAVEEESSKIDLSVKERLPHSSELYDIKDVDKYSKVGIEIDPDALFQDGSGGNKKEKHT